MTLLKICTRILTVSILSAAAFNAHAVISLTPSTTLCSADPATPCLAATHDVNSNLSADEVAALVGGAAGDLTEVYKMNVGDEPTDTGSFAGSYDTTFANTTTDPEDATITYDGSPDPKIDCTTQECYALVKDGNQTPAQYIFDITGWDGEMNIEFTDFWPAQGAISHVALYTGGDVPKVSEPVTLGLLGVGLLGMGLIRRRRRAAS